IERIRRCCAPYRNSYSSLTYLFLFESTTCLAEVDLRLIDGFFNAFTSGRSSVPFCKERRNSGGNLSCF
uniref:Ovule protein n=1 Tax=Parascaris univalens TaxID=6257 RepID=A0A915CIZ2_PARUN